MITCVRKIVQMRFIFAEGFEMSARVLNFVRSPSKIYGEPEYVDLHSMNESSIEIHSRAMMRAKNFLKAEIEIIDSLREVEDDRTYRHFNQTSIYQYAMKTMNLSENVALTLIAIMRKSRSVPELAEAIRAGRVTTSKAKKIISVINEGNKVAWLELAETKTSKQIEKAVVSQNPMAATKESLRYRTADRLELVLGVSEEWTETLKRVKDVASQKSKDAVSTEEALLLAMNKYLETNDPLEKAKRANGKTPLVELPKVSPFSRTVNRKRKPLPAALKHAVMTRDQGQCTEHDNAGTRCENRRWLDVHHIRPLAKGGADELDNLTTLCSEHHRFEHS